MRKVATTVLLSLLIAGCGFGSSTKTIVVTATPAAIPAAQATATPSSATTLTSPGTATPRGPPITSPTSSGPPTGDPLKGAKNTVSHNGYKAISSSIAKTPDGLGKTLYAILGICTGSADGHCQKIFFFLDNQYLGTDTKAPSNEIKSDIAAGTGNIDVTYANYGPNDPLCCPTGQPVTIRYHWNGTRLVSSGTPPGH